MILAGVVSALAALCYAEFASTVPVAGSAYTYGYATLGEFVAWIIGWDLILEYALGAATVAVGWSGYVVSFLADVGIRFPPLLSAAPGTPVVLADGIGRDGDPQPAGDPDLARGRRCCSSSASRNRRASTRSIVGIKVAVVLLIIGVGGMFVSTEYWQPVHPAEHRRVRRVRLERRAARRRRDLLRLHRLRRGLDGGAGGEATRSATCRSASSRRSSSARCSTCWCRA